MSYDPTFSTRSDDATRNRTIYVESISAFPAPISNVITLEAETAYIITKPIAMGINQIKIPDDSNITLGTTNTVVNSLTTSLGGTTPFIFGAIARLAIEGLDLFSDNGGKCLELTAGSGVIPLLFMTGNRIQGFDDIGSIDGAAVVLENTGYILNGAGWSFNNISVLSMAEQNFVLQSGDHITATGTTANLIFRDILGNPSTGDQLFNFDSLTVTNNSFFSNIIFTDVNGGTSGLIKVLTSDTTLDNIFTDIRVDTTNNTVEVVLPDTSNMEIPNLYEITIADLGNAATNNITIIENPTSLSKIDGLTQYVMDEDDQAIIIERADDQWLITGNSKPVQAEDVVYDNTDSGLDADNVQDAIDELEVDADRLLTIDGGIVLKNDAGFVLP